MSDSSDDKYSSFLQISLLITSFQLNQNQVESLAMSELKDTTTRLLTTGALGSLLQTTPASIVDGLYGSDIDEAALKALCTKFPVDATSLVSLLRSLEAWREAAADSSSALNFWYLLTQLKISYRALVTVFYGLVRQASGKVRERRKSSCTF